MPEYRKIRVLAEVEFEFMGAIGIADAVAQAMQHLQADSDDKVAGGGKIVGIRTDEGGRRWNVPS